MACCLCLVRSGKDCCVDTLGRSKQTAVNNKVLTMIGASTLIASGLQLGTRLRWITYSLSIMAGSLYICNVFCKLIQIWAFTEHAERVEHK
mmetsp:Transcript_33903/g.56025  ORF Transcript_33903/g.56025 Transcript_33903/m.56025 type:complete len:91 (+) Transcript_33903:270-542(+)